VGDFLVFRTGNESGRRYHLNVENCSAPEETPAVERLLGLAEVAALCGVSLVSVRRAVWRGELRAVRLGRRVLVRPLDLNEFVAARLTPPQ